MTFEHAPDCPTGKPESQERPCIRCGEPACAFCSRCGGCGRVICLQCDTEPTPPFAFAGDAYAHPHNEAGT